jgi:hypothetical protein
MQRERNHKSFLRLTKQYRYVPLGSVRYTTSRAGCNIFFEPYPDGPSDSDRYLYSADQDLEKKDACGPATQGLHFANVYGISMQTVPGKHSELKESQ